jgi:hypothetical protein
MNNSCPSLSCTSVGVSCVSCFAARQCKILSPGQRDASAGLAKQLQTMAQDRCLQVVKAAPWKQSKAHCTEHAQRIVVFASVSEEGICGRWPYSFAADTASEAVDGSASAGAAASWFLTHFSSHSSISKAMCSRLSCALCQDTTALANPGCRAQSKSHAGPVSRTCCSPRRTANSSGHPWTTCNCSTPPNQHSIIHTAFLNAWQFAIGVCAPRTCSHL